MVLTTFVASFAGSRAFHLSAFHEHTLAPAESSRFHQDAGLVDFDLVSTALLCSVFDLSYSPASIPVRSPLDIEFQQTDSASHCRANW